MVRLQPSEGRDEPGAAPRAEGVSYSVPRPARRRFPMLVPAAALGFGLLAGVSALAVLQAL